MASTIIPAKGVRSLCWEGDDLVDWVSGGDRYRLDGTKTDSRVRYAYRFDAAVATPDGEYAAIYERLGTKGLLLRRGEIVREIDRSFYHAEVYEFPIALWKLADGRAVIAHCPEEYCRIEIEEIDSGRRLTSRSSKPQDVFHSRLEVSPGGRFLVSAGWIWHPIDAVCVYDIAQALESPASLDTLGLLGGFDAKGPVTSAEVSNAAFLDSERIVLVASDDTFRDEDSPAELRPGSVGVYRLSERRFERIVEPEQFLGTLMPIGDRAVGFFEHPKLVDLATGKVVARWNEIDSGRQGSSIISHLKKLPPIARDPANRRFAVASEDSIIVVQLR